MDFGLSASRQAPLAGGARDACKTDAATARPGLLPLSGQHARHRGQKPGLQRHLRVHQRFCRPDDRHAGRAGKPRSADALRKRARNQPRDLLLARSQQNAAGAERGRAERGRQHLAGANRRAGAELSVGAGVRKQRRGHGLLKPAPARPDLGEQLPA
ncbi:hypothetical protein L1887_52506 [Cichorium endivia]|nr:hypothetical protein L1887_52506 [Cichorium endivia]